MPPQLLGGRPSNPLKLMEPLQPPLKLLVLTQFNKAMLSWPLVWQTGLMSGLGQLSDGGVAAATVKVAWPLLPGPQPLVTVKVTMVEPPQNGGAPVLLLVKTALQPPVKLAVASQLAKAALTAAWVWQAGVVVFTGIVRAVPWGTVQVNVLVQVLVRPQAPVAT